MDKTELLNKIKQIDSLTNDEKAYLVNLVNTKKKYGLVWEDKTEDVEEQLRTQLPVLKEVVNKRIEAPPQPSPKGREHEKNAQNPQKSLFELENINQIGSSSSPSGGGREGAVNHLLIEGDNLHALTALTFTHEGAIDVIYIDPPYNTGNKDFKYNDTFVDREDSYRHSKWLSFMHKRLEIAKRLLSDTGVIFISIDDNEQAQLKMLCDEVLGENYFIGNPVRRRRGSQANLSKNISTIHEYILIYGKSSLVELNNVKPNIKVGDYKNPDGDIRGPYVSMPCTNKGGAKYTITTPTGKKISDEWRFKEESFYRLLNENKLVFPKGGEGKPRYKLFLSEKKENGVIDNSWWESIATNQEATIELKEIFLGNVDFNNPKPTGLITHILNLSTNNKRPYFILDFFAGSGTTLHATMQLNAEDGGNRQCILVTNNENNIAEEVCYERNKRVIQGYTNSKGDWVNGLGGNNLRYYKTKLLGREPSLKNKRELTLLATELLCIKEDCYTDATLELGDFAWHKLFTNKRGNFVYVVYDDFYVEDAVELLKTFIANQSPTIKLKVYVFANGQYAYAEEFEDIAANITLAALPDAIYKAYQNVLPKENKEFIPELEDETQVEPQTDFAK